MILLELIEGFPEVVSHKLFSLVGISFADSLDDGLVFPDGFTGRPDQALGPVDLVAKGNDVIAFQNAPQKLFAAHFNHEVMEASVFSGIGLKVGKLLQFFEVAEEFFSSFDLGIGNKG